MEYVVNILIHGVSYQLIDRITEPMTHRNQCKEVDVMDWGLYNWDLYKHGFI
eukprot:gnl/Chilomastix_caulleri/1613.p4 GENE.gnl/Chilomastix_caulleri/1613~~gnl/Chilomastix_caulleri/1613.p4  ORF type:complete len:52 (+),score=3.81 gnl/Chilomastix_caulleri/1613:550-705(+)